MWKQQIRGHLMTVSRFFSDKYRKETVALTGFAAANLADRNPDHPLCACMDSPSFPESDPSSLRIWQGVASMLLTASDEPEFRKTVNINQGFPKEAVDEKSRHKALVEKLSSRPRLKQLLSETQILPDAEFTQEQWQILESLLVLLPVAAAELRLIFKEQNISDYVEITQRAELALGNEENPSDLALVMEHTLSHLLMDEVQDTSSAQIQIIKKLTMGWHESEGKTMFFVGDPMQSIYRFREADVSNFLDIKQFGLGTIKPEAIVLESNFRSRPEIVNWVNQAFPRILPETDDPNEGAISYSPSIAIRESYNPEAVEFHYQVGGDESNEADKILKKVLEIRQQMPHASIGILGRNKKHLYIIAEKLRENSCSFQAVELESLLYKPVIQDLISLTRSVIQPQDRIAWLSILRAPWCGLDLKDLSIITMQDSNLSIYELCINDTVQKSLSEQGQKRLIRFLQSLIPAIENIGRTSLRHAVESAWLRLGGPACIHENEIQDCEVYFNLLKNLELEQKMITGELLNQACDRLWSKSSPDSSLQLMTIHKSKGLEFDVVILPQLQRKGRGQDQALLRWMRLTDRLLIAGLPHSNEKQDSFNGYLKFLEAKYQENENRRLLYVACTRAREKICLFAAGHVNKEGVFKPPAKSSLLSLMWPVVEAEFIKAAEFPTGQELLNEDEENMQKYFRLPLDWQRQPAPDAIALKQPSTAPNAEEEQIEFSWAGETLRITGIAIHRMLQKIDDQGWQCFLQTPNEKIVSSSGQLLRQHGLQGREFNTASENISAAIDNLRDDQRAHWIFSTDHKNMNTEWSLTGVVNHKIHSIIIDRSFIDSANRRWIIDFKSSRHDDMDVEDFLKREKHRYHNQMSRYAEIVSQLDDRQIMLGLYFPLMKEWIEWSWN